MRKITVYEARDGSRFDDSAACIKHEARLDEVDAAESPLGIRPDDSNFNNGHGFIQHTDESVKIAQENLHRITNRANGRVLDDSNDPAYYLWVRLACIDSSFREWGQPYYSTHPSDAEHFEIKR